ncbi:MAG: tRNA (adenosine(37)-N6)-threonylcarbamoyltransferase complex dimerization subunit type 1 TsaB [Bacteroidales bacterium]
MGKILNIETSTRVCSVCLSDSFRILSSREKPDTIEHAKILHPFIEDVLSGAGLGFTDLDAVAVSEGPGSYTGLRIGVSAAKGICYAHSLPLIAVNTLQSMAMHAIEECDNPKALYIPMIDARRMEVYMAVFNAKGEMIEPVKAEIIKGSSFQNYADYQTVYYFGDGAEKCREILAGRPMLNFHAGGMPSAIYMNQLSQKKLNDKAFTDAAYFEPFYLKDFIAGKPKVKGLNI